MKALDGLRLLDLSHMVSGPYTAMLLADLGMDTIKIEPPGEGEITRKLLANDPRNSLHGLGAYFLTLNRNKKSMTLNLKTEAGVQLFYELVKTADIVLDNFSVGVTERLKIDHAHLAEINPRIITCTITGFGETGPDRQRVAYDIVAQAISGGMSITGHADGPPTRSGLLIGDVGAGMMASTGILAALLARERTGQGQHVDISMLDVQVSMMNYIATMYFLSGEIPEKIGNEHFLHVPYNAFPAQDGYIILAVITDAFWKNLMDVVQAPDLNTPDHAGQPGRWRSRDFINQRLTEIFQTNTQSYWLERLNAARIPCAPVNNLAQAFNDTQLLARNMIVEVEHPSGGSVRMPGNPVKLSETYADTFTPPPLLGQHTDEILREVLGKSDDDIATWRAGGVI